MDALMTYAPQVLALLGVWTLAVISPGPDFVATSRYAIARSRRDGVLVGLGVTCGIAVWVTLSLAGLGVAMAHASGPLASPAADRRALPDLARRAGALVGGAT